MDMTAFILSTVETAAKYGVQAQVRANGFEASGFDMRVTERRDATNRVRYTIVGDAIAEPVDGVNFSATVTIPLRNVRRITIDPLAREGQNVKITCWDDQPRNHREWDYMNDR